MGLCRRHGALSAALAFTLCAERAHAERVDLPSDCGSPADFERELRQRLGEDAPVSSVQVSIAPGSKGYHLRVQIGSELRELDDASCSELFRASIVVAVAVLMHAREAKAHEQEPPPPAPPKAPPSEYPKLTLTGGVGAGIGTLPKPVLAFELEGQSLWRSWGIALDARYLLPADKLEQNGQGATLSALGAGVAGVLRPSRFWQARLGFAAQRLSGSGVGIKSPSDSSVWAAGPTLGLGWYPMQRGAFWAGLGAEGQLNAIRGKFQILNYSRMISSEPHVIYPVPWLAGSAFVRLGVVW
ncbi:MAG TPA: hypothetical protein VHB79_11840 [Polyangiaceae bacterium]|nr:hypothetical protein [Polyangiaceae bacterium]